ncbi:N-acetylmuramoyl-L-alanine amidase [Albidovulum inexpectatum]|uniref:N-acetylmuramoyl-L-alanine amidase n=1 Tax=Albidovulum inexpectatum TaxID=196587 RepID=A0A2S5JJT2_9RHOB|nr:N-acetylmuramoyl-L-alanine amidase [Albidovulum inexpectatum]PPB81739.1 N-acetylmuramoyl-L-alanine amidase [Albidovulum inexpectatum]
MTMRVVLAFVLAVGLSLIMPLAALAETRPLLAPESLQVARVDGDLSVVLDLPRRTPFRVYVLADPLRLVVDLRDVDPVALQGLAVSPLGPAGIRSIRDGWSRIALPLPAPFRIASATMAQVRDGARLSLRLEPREWELFVQDAVAAAAEAARWDYPDTTGDAAMRGEKDRIVVALDPGHGGVDPGAQAAGLTEAELMLGFAKELAEVLRAAGVDVYLTRDSDTFVALDERITRARTVGADLMLSLHADSLKQGEATGATIYMLARRASDAASEHLAESHDRADLLAGVDLARQDDALALVMMDLARTETRPRTERLAQGLADALRHARIGMHRRPVRGAAFSVLKAPDFPSLLIEVGFLSSPRDRAHLTDPQWRARFQTAIRDAILLWVQDERERTARLRR